MLLLFLTSVTATDFSARKLPLTQPKAGQQGVKVAPKDAATPSACTC